MIQTRAHMWLIFALFVIMCVQTFYSDSPGLNALLLVLLIVTVPLSFVSRYLTLQKMFSERRRDCLSNAYKVTFGTEQSVGYYNNSATHPVQRLGLNVLESAFYTSAIVHRMLITSWMVTLIGIVVLFVLFALKTSNTNLLIVI